jgi:raffinose/stachyose/melibiose transport system permease protein
MSSISTRRSARAAGGRTARIGAGRRKRRDLHAYAYLAIPLVLMLTFVVWPMAQTVWYSLFKWDGISAASWVGLGNYLTVVTSDWFLEGLLHVLVLLLFYAALPIAIGLLLAAAAGRKQVRGAAVFQTFLFLPQVVTPVVVGLAFGAIYAPEGVLNSALRLVGLDVLARPWLGDFTFALPAVGLIGTWASCGLCFVLFLAGISSIDSELFDAARMDGAGPVREFFSVTLPGLRGQLTVALTLTVIGAVRTFDLIYVMTGGGPGTSTSVPAFQIYNLSFKIGDVGTGSTVAVLLSVIVLLLTYLIGRTEPEETQ